MNESTDPSRPRRRWWIAVLIALPVVIVLGGTFVAAVYLVSLRRRLDAFPPVARTLPAELAAARKEGLPLEPSDLERKPPVPDAENAAPLYVQIDHILEAVPKVEKEAAGAVETAMGPHRTDADRANARTLLQKRAEVVRLAEQAAVRPHCDFHRHFELGPNLLLPEYASVREVARLLGVKARLESDAGDLRSAFQTIQAGAMISRHMGEEPILIGMLVSIAINAIMDKAFRVVVLDHVDDPRIPSFAAHAERAFGRPDIENAFRGESIMGRVCVRIVRENRAGEDVVPTKLLDMLDSGRQRGMMCDAWEARMISYWRRCFAALRAHRGDGMGQYWALKPLGEALDANDGKPTYELASVVMPIFSQAALQVAHDQASDRLRHTLVCIVTYHQRTRHFPDTLADLVGAPPIDVFTGKPLVYRRTPQGFILYSVGENLKDDGGRAKKRNENDKATDIVVQYPMTD